MFVSKRLGRFWGRDFGVWKDTLPKSGEDQQEQIQLWFNKSDAGNNKGRIDLENFKRGLKEGSDPKKGQVLFSAEITESPHFEQIHRLPNQNRFRMFGIFGGSDPSANQDDGYESPDDSYYFNTPEHRQKHNHDAQVIGPGVITKWKMNTKAVIVDGDNGRGADNFRKDQIVLEVFAKGTVATTYERITRQVEDKDQDGKVIGHHTEFIDNKDETEYVERIEYRLSFKGQLWAEWKSIVSDSSFESPFFKTAAEGGWFTASHYSTTTKAGVDPALALLFSHLCTSEYSPAEIKRDLQPSTPPFSLHYMNNFPNQQPTIYVAPFLQSRDQRFEFKIVMG